ncbi:hypothetical protein [Citrobacter braakii]|uniref:hypothetical protein n=1 Tax=Citrobacter braakii TaxID=57706 RepID=UPI00254234E9|nr:hypothetical protein [Citrobacter braakii]WIF78958.1 hypothetical protein QN090_23500 [Citrobacter braakii]
MPKKVGCTNQHGGYLRWATPLPATCRPRQEISYLSSTDIKASNFLHYLIDEFADKAHKKLLGELLEKTQSKED